MRRDRRRSLQAGHNLCEHLRLHRYRQGGIHQRHPGDGRLQDRRQSEKAVLYRMPGTALSKNRHGSYCKLDLGKRIISNIH